MYSIRIQIYKNKNTFFFLYKNSRVWGGGVNQSRTFPDFTGFPSHYLLYNFILHNVHKLTFHNNIQYQISTEYNLYNQQDNMSDKLAFNSIIAWNLQAEMGEICRHKTRLWRNLFYLPSTSRKYSRKVVSFLDLLPTSNKYYGDQAKL